MYSLPASIKRIRSKTTEKRWRHSFSHYKSMWAICCHGNKSFDQIYPKTVCTLFLTPTMLHIKFDQDWPTGFKDIQLQMCETFVTQGQVTSLWVVQFGPKSKLDPAFIPVLVTSNFDDDSIKHERASMETPFSHYKSMGNIFDAPGQLTP